MVWFLLIAFIIIVFGKDISGSATSSRYKSYYREEQKLAKKHGGEGYPTAHVWRHKQGDKAFEAYQKDVNELKKRYGV